jgi:membrane-associated phospholipid phosphatase
VFSSRRSRRTLFPSFVRSLDQTVGRRIYNAPVPTALNKGLCTLSTNADKGVFWAAVVLGIALTGANGRAAARQGALSLIASTTLANLAAKKAVKAPRPKGRALPHRQLHRTPTSPSFPSGHTATAAALATGVWVANPKRGVVIAALALAVGYSRLHVGAHWFSDVAAGNIVGILIGLLGGEILPPPRS